MKEIIQFQIGGFGEIYVLYDEISFVNGEENRERYLVHGELENLPLEVGETVEKVKVNIIKQIILPE